MNTILKAFHFSPEEMNSDQNPCQIYIGRRLPAYIKEEQVYLHICDNGFSDDDIVDIKMPTDAAGASKGYAFVTFASQDIAEKALDTLDGTKIMGKHKIDVEPTTTENSVFMKCPSAHHKYIDLMLNIGMPPKQRREFVSSLPAKILLKAGGKVAFIGDQQSIQKSEGMVRKRFLSNLQQREFKFPCDTENILSILKKFVLTPLRQHLQFIYQLTTQVDHKKRKQNELSILISSQNSDHFRDICAELEVSLSQCAILFYAYACLIFLTEPSATYSLLRFKGRLIAIVMW